MFRFAIILLTLITSISFAQPTLLFTTPEPNDSVTFYWSYYYRTNPMEYRLVRDAANLQIMSSMYSLTPAHTISKQTGEIFFSSMSDMTGDGISECVFRNVIDSRQTYRIVNPVTGTTYFNLSDPNYTYSSIFATDLDHDGSIEICVYRRLTSSTNYNYQYVFYRTQGSSPNPAPEPIGDLLPVDPVLMQNYPNPFNSETVIRYDLPSAQTATLMIFDVMGRVINSIALPAEQPGMHEYRWNGRAGNGGVVASGTYYYQLATSKGLTTKQMIVVK